MTMTAQKTSKPVTNLTGKKPAKAVPVKIANGVKKETPQTKKKAQAKTTAKAGNAVITLQSPANTKLIPLGQLSLSPKNVRKNYTETSLNEMAASLVSAGQIQDLRARLNDKGIMEVVAGGRRYRALMLLMRRKASIRGEQVTKDYPVRVTMQTNEDSDVETSLAENYVREAMHPVDEFKAFADLNKEGKTPEEIADRFGISHMTVRRRLKLSNVHEDLLALCLAGEIAIGQLEALAITDDQEVQKFVWEETPEHSRSPNALKSIIMEQKPHMNSNLAEFVGVEAYEKKGGTITRDLFSDENESYLDNPDLLRALAIEKLDLICDEHRGKGWKWVEVCFDFQTLYSCDNIFRTVQGIKKQDIAKVEALNKKADSIEGEYDKLPEDAEHTDYKDIRDRLDAVNEQVRDIEEPYKVFKPAEMAHAGVMIILSNGEAVTHMGKVKPEDKKHLAAMRKNEAEKENGVAESKPDNSNHAEQEEMGADYSMALVEDLSTLKTAALGVELANNPNVALCAILHSLVCREFYKNDFGVSSISSAVEIAGNRQTLRFTTPDEDNCGAIEANNKLLDDWKAVLPEDAKDLWSWLLEENNQTRLELLAVVTAQQVNALQLRHNYGAQLAHAEQIAEAVNLDMGKWWKPSEGFLTRIKKDAGRAMLVETKQSSEFIQSVDKMSKKDATPRILAKIANSKWLPSIFRKPKPQPQADKVNK